MKFLCPVNSCCSDFKNKDDFFSHIKNNHYCSEKQFCENLLSKKDFFSGEKIKFKSIEQYILTDFSGKKNMLSWMKSQETKLVKKFIFDKIKNFSFLKSVGIFPSCSEIRTISFLPSIKTIEYFFENLNEFIDSTSLVRRYNYNLSELKLNFIFEKNSQVIAVDTREQKPIQFKGIKTEIKKVEYGDYTCDEKLSVERKSLSDLVSTLSSGFERFKKEVERAKNNNGYIVVVTECDINKFLSFSFSGGRFLYSKASTEFVFHRLREVSRLFPDTLQFCFSGGRKESSILIPKILSKSSEEISKIDIQYLIEKRVF